MALFYAVVPDVDALWLEWLDFLIEVWRDAGQGNLAAAVEQQKAIIAQYATPFFVAAAWMVQAGSLMLGYVLYKRLPNETDNFGRFRDLNFGRVLAVSLAVIFQRLVFTPSRRPIWTPTITWTSPFSRPLSSVCTGCTAATTARLFPYTRIW